MSTKKLQFDSPGGGWWYKSISEYIYNGHSCIFKCSSSLTNFVYNLHYHKQKRILVISLACWIKILKVKQCQNRGKSNIIQWKNSPLKCKKNPFLYNDRRVHKYWTAQREITACHPISYLSNPWWMANSVSKVFGPVMRTGLSRQFPKIFVWVLCQFPFTVAWQLMSLD